MTMSMARIGRSFAGLAVLAAVTMTAGAALAAMGQPADWNLGLQDSASPVMDDIRWFHDFLLVIITVITLFVLALLLVVMTRFNARANPTSSKTTHNTLIEILWTGMQNAITGDLSVKDALDKAAADVDALLKP